MDTAVGDGGVQAGPGFAPVTEEEGGQRPDHPRQPGRFRAAPLEEGPHPVGIRPQPVVQRLGLGPEEEVQYPEVHPQGVQRMPRLRVRGSEEGVDRVGEGGRVGGRDAPAGVQGRAEAQDAVEPLDTLVAVVAQPPEPAHGQGERAGLARYRTGSLCRG
ncbi:hypothetical protein H8R17_24510 [Streptomyces sp. TRM68367]|nr:hypothetical protein [Streptomyces sp. TRM68367]